MDEKAELAGVPSPTTLNWLVVTRKKLDSHALKRTIACLPAADTKKAPQRFIGQDQLPKNERAGAECLGYCQWGHGIVRTRSPFRRDRERAPCALIPQHRCVLHKRDRGEAAMFAHQRLFPEPHGSESVTVSALAVSPECQCHTYEEWCTGVKLHPSSSLPATTDDGPSVQNVSREIKHQTPDCRLHRGKWALDTTGGDCEEAGAWVLPLRDLGILFSRYFWHVASHQLVGVLADCVFQQGKAVLRPAPV